MKRLVIMAVMAAFILGTVGMASAIEFKASGDWQMSANYVKNPNLSKDLKDDPFQVVQRFRTTFEFVANENLKGVIRFNTHTIRSGANAGRGNLDIGTRNNVWDLDRAYLDFMIPNTQVNIKAGLQPVTLPSTLGSHILDDNVWAFTASTQFNDMVGLTVGWARLADVEDGGVDTTGDGLIDSKNKDEVDMFMAIVPVTMDGFQINPFMAYARLGKNALNDDVIGVLPDYTDGNYESASLFHAGINFTVDMFDPIVIMGDFNYGTMSEVYDDNGANSKFGSTRGWMADLAVAYKMDMMTPMIFGLYESGESSSSAANDKKGKVMPNVLSADNWNISSFGFGGSDFRPNAGYRLGLDGATGKWAVGFRLDDISFVEKLDHQFNIVYYKGTNDDNAGAFFDEDDSAWEVNFDTQYQMYENLAAIVELGYLDLDHDDLDLDAAWKAAAGFRFRF